MIKVSFVIPTLNAESVLDSCLKSIKKQTISPRNYEIIISDGGSTDSTISIARKYNSKVINNHLKTAEAGKAVGVKFAKGKYIALIDSDNILPDKGWLKINLDILDKDSSLIGTEPLFFTYRPKAGYIERYSALFGVNDPYAFITGVYDKKNYINYRWTGLKINQIDNKKYIQVELKPNSPIPTIGANGTLFRADFLKKNLKSKYLFDVDIISQYLNKIQKTLYFAKVKQGIIHTFCENSLKKFIRKQKRRITDFFYYQNIRTYNWNKTNQFGILKFTLYTLLIFPALFDSFKGFIHKPDISWFFHPLACWLTLIVYSTTYLKFKLGFMKPISRVNWNQ